MSQPSEYVPPIDGFSQGDVDFLRSIGISAPLAPESNATSPSRSSLPFKFEIRNELSKPPWLLNLENPSAERDT